MVPIGCLSRYDRYSGGFKLGSQRPRRAEGHHDHLEFIAIQAREIAEDIEFGPADFQGPDNHGHASLATDRNTGDLAHKLTCRSS